MNSYWVVVLDHRVAADMMFYFGGELKMGGRVRRGVQSLSSLKLSLIHSTIRDI